MNPQLALSILDRLDNLMVDENTEIASVTVTVMRSTAGPRMWSTKVMRHNDTEACGTTRELGTSLLGMVEHFEGMRRVRSRR